jgi:hypothetical protein
MEASRHLVIDVVLRVAIDAEQDLLALTCIDPAAISAAKNAAAALQIACGWV